MKPAARPPQDPIAVGVDGSACAGLALDWAAEEATRRKLPLHIVHAFSVPVPDDQRRDGFRHRGRPRDRRGACARRPSPT